MGTRPKTSGVKIEPRKYAIGVVVHLNRFPEPGPRAEENAGWRIDRYVPDGYIVVHPMGGVTNVSDSDIAYEVRKGRRKHPNPRAYWLQQAALLFEKQPALYAELIDFRFCGWRAQDISYKHVLAKKVIAVLGNEWNYAEGTIVDSIKKAIGQHERGLRRERALARHS